MASLVSQLEAAGIADDTVIVISSELPELLGLSDRIYTIFEGAITGEVSKAEATQENLMRLMTSSGRKPADYATQGNPS